MARTHGRDADFAFDDFSTMEEELNSVTMTFSMPSTQITAFADAWRNVRTGKPTATIDVSGLLNMAAGKGDITVFGELGLDAEEWDFEPAGSTGYNGLAIVTSHSVNSSVGSAATYSTSFRHNGASTAADGGAPTRA